MTGISQVHNLDAAGQITYKWDNHLSKDTTIVVWIIKQYVVQVCYHSGWLMAAENFKAETVMRCSYQQCKRGLTFKGIRRVQNLGKVASHCWWDLTSSPKRTKLASGPGERSSPWNINTEVKNPRQSFLSDGHLQTPLSWSLQMLHHNLGKLPKIAL